MTREAVVGIGAFALVAALGFDDGGYPPSAWGWSSVVVLAVLAVLLGRGVGRPGRAALALVAALAGLAAWTAASLAWSGDFSASVLEIERVVLYLGASAVFVLAAPGRALLAGILAATTLLCGYGLARWLLGEPEVPLSADPEAAGRLSEPVGYANGVAILAVIGLLLAIGFAARATRTSAAAVAAAPLPLLAATLYFTFSRGGWVALAGGLTVAIVVGPQRLQLAATAVVLGGPAALAVLAADRLGAEAAVAVVVVLACALSAALAVGLRSVAYRPSLAVRRAFAAALIGLPLLLAVAVLVKAGGPGAAYDSFKAAPTPTHGRALSLSGSNRADYWSVAWRSYEDEPVLGAGAGTYARTWVRERPVPQPVVDAHSLYLETLAELGPLGLALLVLALAAPLAARRNRWTPVALAPYAAFLVHAAQDWDWELPAVTVAALACGAAPIAGQSSARLPRLAAVVPAALSLLAAFAFLGNRAVEDSIAASDRLAYGQAEDAARRARSLQPWSPEPWRLLGEIELAEGSLAVARRYFREGLQEDGDDWELWLDLGLASEGAAQRRAFAEVARLNPLSPELREYGFKTG
jgi:O-antigen ligase